MNMRLLAAAALTAAIASSPSQAAPVFTVTAAFDPFVSGNTTFSVTNTSGSTETNVDLISGGAMQLLGTLLAGAKATYAFNQVSGPFVVEPGAEGLPDSTTYRVSATVLGQTVTTAGFSSKVNLTGGYVDFLGACYNYSVGCSVDPSGTYPLSGVVANASLTAVPAPASALLFGSGLVSLAALRRRPAQSRSTRTCA